MEKLDLTKPLYRVPDGEEPGWCHEINNSEVLFEAADESGGFGWCDAYGHDTTKRNGTIILRNAPELVWHNLYRSGGYGPSYASKDAADASRSSHVVRVGYIRHPKGSTNIDEWELIKLDDDNDNRK